MATKKSETERAKNPPLLPLEGDFSLRNLKLESVRTDGGTQMRVETRPDVVQDYADKYEREIDLPEPVAFFDGTDYWLADGFQRKAGAELAKRTKLKFRVYQGTQRQAILYAVGANEEHGLKRTNKDRRHAVETLLNDGEWNLSDRWVATTAHVSPWFVGKVRGEIEERARLARVGAAQEPPLDIPADFRPDPQHSPPAFGEEFQGENTVEADAKPARQLTAQSVEAATQAVTQADDEPRLYDEFDNTTAGHAVKAGGEADEEAASVPSDDGASNHEAEPAPELRLGRDGRKRQVKRKPQPVPLPDVNPLAADDVGPEVAAGLTAIGEPVTELTRPAFAAVREMNAWGREIDRLVRDAGRFSDLACHATFSYIQMQFGNAKRGLLDYRPYAHCHQCRGEGCSQCKFGGHITKKQHEALLRQQSQDEAADQAA